MKLNNSDIVRINKNMGSYFQYASIKYREPKTLGEAARLLNDITHKIIIGRYRDGKS